MRAALVLIAACGSTPPSVVDQHTAPIAPPTTPAPSLRWVDNGFDTERLPAVARDGKTVVLGIHVEDPRGLPNLTLVIRDRNDGNVRSFPVLGIEEIVTMFDDQGPTPALRARIADGNQLLADAHRGSDLVPLAPTTEVQWAANHLTIKDAVDRGTPASWLAPGGPRDCTYPASLAAAWIDRERKLAVVTISYTSSDTCSEPPSQHHVIAW